MEFSAQAIRFQVGRPRRRLHSTAVVKC